MIDVSNLKDTLKTLGFIAYGDIYEKVFSEIGCSLKVDFQAKRLIYPNEIKGRERNNGFDKKENFVVFECVCRLLLKEYRPEHIELEKEWHLGHDPKGGRADICVTDTSGNMLFIIECKTWGKAYDKALNNTKNDGAQLFSYWQQEQSCKWLVLYASDLKGGCIVHKASTIDCSDDANIVLLSKKDKSIKLYRDANTASAKYEAWKETYGRQIHDDLIFSKDSVAYQIGVKPLRKKDLRDFTPDDKIVNKFEEILRHNNVSDKENAFNRLVALFICKLVDESIKDEDDEVEFQYKQGTDTYETLQDRLQRLHRDGMEKFMREEILYVPADYPEWLFLTYTGSKRKSAIEDLRNTIRILKFYSNNEFTFKDVHNEELFYQNGKILVEMVQLFEKYRKAYQQKSADEQAAAYLERLYSYASSIEREKLFYFSLVYQQTTVIITAPADNKAQKEFLGYDWSNRKGNEGIQIITPGGKMYDDADRAAEGTLANAVKVSFEGLVPQFSEDQLVYGAAVATKNMLDYSRAGFNKSIRISVNKKIVIESKYPLKTIDELQVLLKRGKSPTYGDSKVQVIKSGQARGYRDFDFSSKYYLAKDTEIDERKLQKGDILINSTGVGTAGRVTLFELDGDYVVDSHITIFRPNDEVLPTFVLLVLSSVVGFKTLEKMADGSSGQVELSIETIKSIKVPVPPIPVQQEIVDACAKIDEEFNTTRMSIETYRQKIADLFAKLDVVMSIAGRGTD